MKRRDVETTKRRQAKAACGLAVLSAIALAILQFGCTQENDSQSTSSTPVEKTIERGPVSFTVRAGSKEISVGENLSLTVEAVAEPGVAVTMPVISESLGVFEIVTADTPPDIPDGEKRRWTHRYSLRTLESGEQEIPPIALSFIDERTNAGSGADDLPVKHDLQTPPLTIRVTSLLAGEFNPEEYRDIKGEIPVELPWNPRNWVYGGIVGMVAIGAFWLLWKIIRRRQAVVPPPPPPLPAHVTALRALDQLAADRLIERGEFREFYFRLSTIVRRYIEDRFAIMAVEQTTEEFLHEARRHPALSDSHRDLLKAFLRQADMVKFAKFQPQSHEGEAALAAARRFVEDTSRRSTSVAGDTDGDPIPAATADPKSSSLGVAS